MQPRKGYDPKQPDVTYHMIGELRAQSALAFEPGGRHGYFPLFNFG